MALDLGLKRLGVAVSLDGKIVTPLPAILRKNRNQAAKDFSKLLHEWEIEHLVVGIPYGGSSEEEMKRRVKHFCSLLEFDGTISYQDESGSSLEAQELLKGQMQYKRDGRVDSLAAMIILQRFLKIF